MEISLSDRLSSLNDAFGNRLNGEIGNTEVSSMVSAVLSTLGLTGKENKNFSTSVVENNKEEFFGIRVFPRCREFGQCNKETGCCSCRQKNLIRNGWESLPGL